jgi:hypothetical protein
VTDTQRPGEREADHRVRAQLVKSYRSWVAESRLTPEQEQQVLSILADAQDNYAAARAEANDALNDAFWTRELSRGDADSVASADEADGAFDALVPGGPLEAEMDAALSTVLDEQQLAAFKQRFPVFMLLVSPRVRLVEALPAR